jgi:hypothetical protein
MLPHRHTMTNQDPLSEEQFAQRVRQAVVALPDAPPALRRQAIDLWPKAAAQQPLREAAAAVLHQITALLSFDSWATPALAGGMRSVRAPTRHMLFSAMGRDIDLRITPAGSGYSLAGQILGPDEGGRIEVAATTGSGVHQARLDELGEFHIEGVAVGTYVLTLHMGTDAIVLPPVEVGPGA